MDGEVRLARTDDRSAVERIVTEAYSPYIERIGRAPGPMLDDYRALIGDGRVHVFVREGVIQGFLVLEPLADALLLDNVAVSDSARGQGVGKALLAFTEATARDRAYSVIRLYTNTAMTENVGLYARLGYVVTGRRTENGFDRIYVEKRLPAA